MQDLVKQRDDTYFRIKNIMTDFPERACGDEDLYDLKSDPHELHDLAGLPEHRQRLSQFKSQVLDWWHRTGGNPLPDRFASGE